MPSHKHLILRQCGTGGRARSAGGRRALRLAIWLYARPPLGRASVTRLELAILIRLATRHSWAACWWLEGALDLRALRRPEGAQ